MTSTVTLSGGSDIDGLVADLAEAAARLARAAAPGHGPSALAQADVLMEVKGYVELAVEARVSMVERTGAAQAAGYASVAAWLRNGGTAARAPVGHGNGNAGGTGPDGGSDGDAGGTGNAGGGGAATAGAATAGAATAGAATAGAGAAGGGRRGGRMSRGQAGVVRRNALQFRRLPKVLATVRGGLISHEMAAAIAAALSVLPRDCDLGEVADMEQVLLELALDPQTTPEKVALVGRYLRDARNPDGNESEEDKAYGKRYLAVHVDGKGGMLGRFYLPGEAAAKMRQILDDYARARDAADDRTVIQRNADALIQVLNHKVATQICLLINAESLPDSHPHRPGQNGAGDSGNSAGAGETCDGSESGAGGGGDSSSGGGDGGEDCGAAAGQAAGTEAAEARVARTSADFSVTCPGPAGAGDRAVGGGNGHDGWLRPYGLDDKAREQVRLTLANLARAPAMVQPDPLPCDGCGRPANRNTPGLLLPTGHPMPAKHVRRLLYTSQVFRVILDAKGRVLDTSYGMRLVPDWMKRLVLLQYDRCGYDDCPIEAKYAEMDHVFGWAEFNRTKPDEIIPACGWHNRDRAMHPDKYRLEKLPTGHWHFTSTRRRN